MKVLSLNNAVCLKNMTHKTRGIVLRTLKYGETSLVVTIFTELFGVQTYMVNGVRTTKKSGARAILYQPAAILDLEVYHNEMKSMQRIKESNWAGVFQHLFSDVIRNSIALYMVELLYKVLRQPEQHSNLYYFSEDALTRLDEATPGTAANLPLYFALHLPHFLGFRFSEPATGMDPHFLDLVEGQFVDEPPHHTHYLSGEDAQVTAELLRIMQFHELEQVKLNRGKRMDLLSRYQDYYALHLQDFGKMKTLQVLHEVLS